MSTAAIQNFEPTPAVEFTDEDLAEYRALARVAGKKIAAENVAAFLHDQEQQAESKRQERKVERVLILVKMLRDIPETEHLEPWIRCLIKKSKDSPEYRARVADWVNAEARYEHGPKNTVTTPWPPLSRMYRSMYDLYHVVDKNPDAPFVAKRPEPFQPSFDYSFTLHCKID